MMAAKRGIFVTALLFLSLVSTINVVSVEAKSFETEKSKVPLSQLERFNRDTYTAAALDAKQNVLERLKEIESVPEMVEFISSASPCLQPVLAELWQGMQRDAYEKRRRTRYSRAIKRGISISRSQGAAIAETKP